MARLSDLCKAREILQDTQEGYSDQSDVQLLGQLDAISSHANFRSPDIDILSSIMSDKRDTVSQIFDDLRSRMDRWIDEWQPSCESHNAAWISELMRFTWEEWCEWRDVAYAPNPALDEFVAARISENINWQSPSLIYKSINPALVTDCLGSYPIYLVSKYKQSFDEIREMFHISQVRKLRFYDNDRTSQLPQDAIGLMVSVNHFTHASERHIQRDLMMLSDLLMPGGILMFNINDCDYSKCARFFEQGARSYVRGKHVDGMIEEAGLIVTKKEYLSDPSSLWIEVRKPGTRTSIKKAEALGRIMEKGK